MIAGMPPIQSIDEDGTFHPFYNFHLSRNSQLFQFIDGCRSPGRILLQKSGAKVAVAQRT